MGFIVNGDTYLLKFTDGRYSGMHIEVAPLDIDSMIEMSELERSDGIGGPRWAETGKEYFLRSLVSWDLEWRDPATGEVRPLERTPEDMGKVTLAQFVAIYRAWMRVLIAPSEDPDLGKGSPPGGPSLEELPMTEPSFANPPN